jgi:hypothetical protein
MDIDILDIFTIDIIINDNDHHFIYIYIYIQFQICYNLILDSDF